jgi:murein DD-endopeptidase MepM/ murein hydrolase activator NlpD
MPFHASRAVSGLLSVMLLLLSNAGGSARAEPPGDVHGFVLPYPVGSSYPVIQGNGGEWGHTDTEQYAYDFEMAVGTPVVAARSGRVVAVEERHEDGNRTPGEENYVFIRHDDATFSRYYHLSREGVLVDEGERVKRGQQIGLSGNTGASAGPHLHFDVTTGCPEWGCQTIEIQFSNASENPLRQGESYEALPY